MAPVLCWSAGGNLVEAKTRGRCHRREMDEACLPPIAFTILGIVSGAGCWADSKAGSFSGSGDCEAWCDPSVFKPRLFPAVF